MNVQWSLKWPSIDCRRRILQNLFAVYVRHASLASDLAERNVVLVALFSCTLGECRFCILLLRVRVPVVNTLVMSLAEHGTEVTTTNTACCYYTPCRKDNPDEPESLLELGQPVSCLLWPVNPMPTKAVSLKGWAILGSRSSNTA